MAGELFEDCCQRKKPIENEERATMNEGIAELPFERMDKFSGGGQYGGCVCRSCGAAVPALRGIACHIAPNHGDEI